MKKVPWLAVGHGGRGEPIEEMIGVFDFGAKLVRICLGLRKFASRSDGPVKFVELQPHLRGDDFADGPGIFARRPHTGSACRP